MGRAKPGTRIALARPPGGDSPFIAWVIDGKTTHNGDEWAVVTDVQTLTSLARSLGARPDMPRDTVLIRLNLAGYWPSKVALDAYLTQVDAIRADAA